MFEVKEPMCLLVDSIHCCLPLYDKLAQAMDNNLAKKTFLKGTMGCKTSSFRWLNRINTVHRKCLGGFDIDVFYQLVD